MAKWKKRLSAIFKTMQIIVLLNFNQIERTPRAEASAYPNPYDSFVVLFEFMALDFNFLPLACARGERFGHLDYLFISTVVPFAFFALSIGIIVLLRKFKPTESQYAGPAKGLVALIILVLPSISRTICQSFRCEEFDGGSEEYLMADLSIDCLSSTYRLQFVYSLVCIVIFPVGVPLAFACILFPLRARLDPPAPTEAEAIALRAEDEGLEHSIARQLFRVYRPRYWWYELVDILRRLALTCFVLVFEKMGTMLTFAVFVALLTTVIQREAQPYLDPWLASLVYLCHWMINMSCISIVLVESRMVTDSDSVLLGVLMIIFVSAEGRIDFARRSHVPLRRSAPRTRLTQPHT